MSDRGYSAQALQDYASRMEATIQSLTEENERLKAAYARLVERLRLATPHSLYAQTEQDIESLSTTEDREP